MPPPRNAPSSITIKSPTRGERPSVRCQFLLHQLKMPSTETTDPAEMVPIYRALFVNRNTLEQILDFGKLRYHLFLAFNSNYDYCAENVCLRALYDALHGKDEPRQRLSANSCVNLFMPTVRKDYAARMHMGPSSDEYDDLYTGVRGPPIKIQVTTTPRQLGLEITFHESPRVYPIGGANCSIANTHPKVLTFEREEVELQKELERGIYTAVVAGRRCWVKTARFYFNAAGFQREVDALVKAPRQHTIQQLVGFVVVDGTGADKEGGERIDGIVLRARRGKVRQLRWIDSCTMAEGWKWKCQIGGAVELLHKADVIWGRAIPENVMIDRDGNALIIDFAGSPASDSRQSDMNGLYQIFSFIDGIMRIGGDPIGNPTDGYSGGDENEIQSQGEVDSEWQDQNQDEDGEGGKDNELQAQDDISVDEDEADINAAYW